MIFSNLAPSRSSRFLGVVCAGAVALGLGQVASAQSAFQGVFTIDGQTARATSTSITSFVELFSDSGLASLSDVYTPNSAVRGDIVLRGIPAVVTYAANSPVLRLQVPGIGLDRTFEGTSRDQSQQLAEDWFKGAGSSEVTRLLQYAVATTSIDPVAGNPNSLMSNMGAADFGAATGGVGGGASAGPAQRIAAQGGNRFGFGARFGSYSGGGFDTSVYTLPLSYSLGFSDGSALILDVPLTLIESAGTQAYSGSLGVGYRVPVPVALPEWARWSLTPMIRGGAVGSTELGAAGAMWSASLTSSFDIRLADTTSLTIGNMVARLETIPISYGQTNIDYNLQNNMFRNGAVITQRVGEMFGRSVSASVFAVDTRFTGDALFVSYYQEYGAFLTLGDPVELGGLRVPLRLGATYVTGENGYNGFTINLGMGF